MDFLLSWQSYYDTIQLKEDIIIKKIVIYKEFEIILESTKYIQTENEIIKMIQYMNKNDNYFIFYEYEVRKREKVDEIIIKHKFVPTLEMHCRRYGFNKKKMDKMVEDICGILDVISWHGNITSQTIYIKNRKHYLSDIHFKEILSNNKKPRNVQDDIYSLVLVLYNIIKCQSELKTNIFFEKGLSKNKTERFQTINEMKKFYYLNMPNFISNKQNKMTSDEEIIIFKESKVENSNQF